METRVAKRPSSLHRALSYLKRKRATHHEKCSGRPACISSASPKFRNLKKQYKSKSKFCNSKSAKSLLGCYSNIKSSGHLKRLMYYENEKWNDLPVDFVASVKSHVKNVAINLIIDGHEFLLDFLHMMRIDLATGLQQPIAWINEVGKCFFPETFTANDNLHENYNSPIIKLELEIQLDGSECSRLKDSSGESDNCVDFSCAKTPENEIKNEHLNENVVRDMFMKGTSSLKNAEIVEILKGSSTLSKSRLELFTKQIEITKGCRGDANVRYAWFPSSKEEVSNILTYGIGCTNALKIKPIYGFGVHLFPANCMHLSESYSDVDENGMGHIVFCHVIMGKMEVIECGSKQMFPSSEDYDNGVDDLQNPGWFVVWNMNKTTHVYPEYVVTFRVSSDSEGLRVRKENEIDISGVNLRGQELQKQLESNGIPADVGNACYLELPAGISCEAVKNTSSITRKTQRSPWMPFSVLLSEISNKIAPKEMEKLMMSYESLRNKSMNREDFEKELRSIVRVDLLRSAVENCRCKMAKKAESNLDAQNQDMKEI